MMYYPGASGVRQHPKSSVRKPDSDALRNRNSWEYLLRIKIPPFMFKNETHFPYAAKVYKQVRGSEPFNPTYPYGDLYTQFLEEVESYIEQRLQANGGILPESEGVDELLELIFQNDNPVLEYTAKVIAPILARHKNADMEKAIEHELKSVGKPINKITPSDVNAPSSRFMATFINRDFKPMQTTSLPSIRRYTYQQPSQPIEFRWGTQVQRHHNKARVSPLFVAWCSIQQRKYAAHEGKIAHLYINLLGRDRNDFEGNKEKALSHELEALGEQYPSVVVITLPADKLFMSVKKLEGNQVDSIENIKASILSAALKNERDFYISESVKSLLYPEEAIEQLFNNSLRELGFSDKDSLTETEQLALFFHFVKFELTHFIIGTLQSDSFNMSCKDGIDRAGAASAYYNLIKSIQQGSPLSRQEFERAIHAAPALVKGRGMNYHAKILYNAIDYYLQAKQASNEKLPEGAEWLLEWRDDNNRLQANKKNLYREV